MKKITSFDIQQLIQRCEQSYRKAQKQESEIFNLLEKLLGDLERIEIDNYKLADNNLKSALSCYLNYGDGDINELVDEIASHI